MPDLIKHLVLLGLAVPVGLGGYHLAASVLSPDAEGTVGSAEAADLSFGRSGYRLAALPVLERDTYWLESRYVERDRLDPEAMFAAALDALEREYASVLFQREPEGRRLHVSIGEFSTVLLVEPMESLSGMAVQLRRVAALLDEHLPADLDRPSVEYTLVNGALSTLDPHTILMPPEAASEMDVDNKGEFAGLGIEITLDKEGRLTVKQPIEDTPAAAAGLQADDRIVRIDEESTINMDLQDAVRKLRGRKGEPVTIMVMRKGFAQPRAYTIVRDTIKVNPVEGELLEGDVGYVRIKTFHDGVGEDLDNLLSVFRRDAGGPLRGLVLDVRSNPGGYLTEAVLVADKFLTEGVIVATVEGGTGRREEQRASRAGTAPDFPIVVLVNSSSASASEIVAGALRNQDRGVILGERSFGKGSVQHLYNHDDGSRLKLTVAKYYTPGDESIQAIGIPPDIELRPTVVEPADAAEDALPFASLHWREWVEREGDLDNVLGSIAEEDLQPAWTLRYLHDAKGTDADVPQQDWQVQLAREILLAAPGSRRADVLGAASGVVQRRADAEAQRIAAAMREIGVDWAPGAPAAPAQLDVRLDLGEDDALRAGEAEDVALLVTNRGSEPVFQVAAISTSENPYLDHREFVLGRIDPGQTRRAVVRVDLQEGYPSEVVPVSLDVRSGDGGSVALVESLVRSVGRPLPAFTYSLALHDGDGQGGRGDGDGLPEVGEVIALELEVTNVGEGPSAEAFARLKNRAGRGVDLRTGSLELGEPRDADGRACVPDSDGCRRVLQPGESYTSALEFELREPIEEGWRVDLQLGDNRAYDFATVQRGGFFDYFQLQEELTLTPGEPFAAGPRQPPTVSVTRGPDEVSAEQAAVISGRAADDEGVAEVIVFHGDEKVFFRGGHAGDTTMPFSVERALRPGENLLVVLVRDVHGLTATHAISTWYSTTQAEARAAHGGGAG